MGGAASTLLSSAMFQYPTACCEQQPRLHVFFFFTCFLRVSIVYMVLEMGNGSHKFFALQPTDLRQLCFFVPSHLQKKLKLRVQHGNVQLQFRVQARGSNGRAEQTASSHQCKSQVVMSTLGTAHHVFICCSLKLILVYFRSKNCGNLRLPGV